MNRISRNLLSFGAVLAAAGGLQLQPAHAQLSIGIPLGRGGPILNIPIGPLGNQNCNHCGKQHPRNTNENKPSSKPSDDGPIAPTSHEETALLKGVFISPQLSGFRSVKSVMGPKTTAKAKEDERDVGAKIQQIIKRITDLQDEDAKKNPRIVASTGDITEHAIEQSLETAFKNARLDTFERFASENWTTERLRVKVLNIVFADLDRLLKGTTRGNVPMHQLDELIQHAAEKTYARIFELSELLAANRESALFMQRLYQTHGNLVDDQMREGAAPTIFEAANAAIAPFDVTMRQDPNAYALRYRAERIVYDCLSENVERISSSENGISAVAEIKQKISATAVNVCTVWIERQFGAQRGTLLPQKPLPLRVVWSATGPKDDPTMYTSQAAR